MRHDSVVSRYAIPIGIPQVDGWSTGPPEIGASHNPHLIYLVSSPSEICLVLDLSNSLSLLTRLI